MPRRPSPGSSSLPASIRSTAGSLRYARSLQETAFLNIRLNVAIGSQSRVALAGTTAT